MKKKLIATLVAGAVLSTGLIGLTACGLSVPNGNEVADAAAWKRAFDRTDELTNCTMEVSGTAELSVDGTIKSSNSDKTHKYTSKTNNSSLILINEEDDKAYMEVTSKTEKKGTSYGSEVNSTSSGTRKRYYELSEKEGTSKTYWCASYGKSEDKTIDSVASEEYYWTARETSYISDIGSSSIADEYFYVSKDATSSSQLSDLFEKFTYSGGVYTANLYIEISIESITTEMVECNVTVSIKDDYILGLGLKIDASNRAYEKGYYDFKYTYKAESVCVISNIKSTDVSKKANKDVNKAIEKAKAEKEDEE